MKRVSQAEEIVQHYRRQGHVGAELRRKVARHARLLAPLDRGVSGDLWAKRLNRRDVGSDGTLRREAR